MGRSFFLGSCGWVLWMGPVDGSRGCRDELSPCLSLVNHNTSYFLEKNEQSYLWIIVNAEVRVRAK